jgi:hypothetical protein
MNLGYPWEHLQLANHHASDNQIDPMPLDLPALIRNEDPLLTLVAESGLLEFQTECPLIDPLLEPRP